MGIGRMSSSIPVFWFWWYWDLNSGQALYHLRYSDSPPGVFLMDDDTDLPFGLKGSSHLI
jgi:hypothetical protein